MNDLVNAVLLIRQLEHFPPKVITLTLLLGPLFTRERPQVRSWLAKPLPTIRHLSHCGRSKLLERLHILSPTLLTKSSWIRMICCWTFRRWIWSLPGRNRKTSLNCNSLFSELFMEIQIQFDKLNMLFCLSQGPCETRKSSLQGNLLWAESQNNLWTSWNLIHQESVSLGLVLHNFSISNHVFLRDFSFLFNSFDGYFCKYWFIFYDIVLSRLWLELRFWWKK